ncbi:MAG: 3-isopropylmalate dehydrogenase [Candidatus Eiseniibacteriota bacterium]|jgi:3-isopropylmalate dehydrogenase
MTRRSYDIAVVPGDGIGPEVVREARALLDRVAGRCGFELRYTEYPHGADHYLATGELFPDAVLDEIRDMHAVLLGAIGDPRVEIGLLERAIVGGLRWKLDLYVNLRPIRLYAEHLCPLKNVRPADLDLLVVRENTEDVYVGLGGFFKQGTPDEVALAEMIVTRKGCERAIRHALELAAARPRRRLHLVDKANAIAAHRLWRRTLEAVAPEYPSVETDVAYIDAACMWLVKNPAWFDVVVTTNMFGDIFTDLGAILQGGMGIAASGNIHPGRVSMFEPIHGSAPKYRDRNVANPMAAMAAGQMMLDFLGERLAACAIEEALRRVLVERRVPSLGTDSGLSTAEIGAAVAEVLDGALAAVSADPRA